MYHSLYMWDRKLIASMILWRDFVFSSLLRFHKTRATLNFYLLTSTGSETDFLFWGWLNLFKIGLGILGSKVKLVLSLLHRSLCLIILQIAVRVFTFNKITRGFYGGISGLIIAQQMKLPNKFCVYFVLILLGKVWVHAISNYKVCRNFLRLFPSPNLLSFSPPHVSLSRPTFFKAPQYHN